MSAKPYNAISIPASTVAGGDERFHQARRYVRSQAFRTVFGGAARAVGNAAAQAIASVRRARIEQAAYRELAALDDRMLRDIGITRGEIRQVVRGERRAVDDGSDARRPPRRGRPVPGARHGRGAKTPRAA
jgi:uncharacterized protein YjiS (DUF1127 family)